jgi:PTS system mannose-specific IIB component/fructoselysine and glucoselysine-specific PTS system IIB component
MPIVLFRIDERLIHGQVVVGWGGQLRPDLFVVVDDGLVSSQWEQELYLLGVPEGTRAVFLSPEQARQALPELKSSPERAVILTRDVATMLAMAREGAMEGDTVNLGGLHSQSGREEVLPYLFLDDADRDRLREISQEGVQVTARDLPGSHEVPLTTLLD